MHCWSRGLKHTHTHVRRSVTFLSEAAQLSVKRTISISKLIKVEPKLRFYETKVHTYLSNKTVGRGVGGGAAV